MARREEYAPEITPPMAPMALLINFTKFASVEGGGNAMAIPTNSPDKMALFRTLIAAKDSPFSAPFRPSPRRTDFYPEFGQSSDVISSQKLGHFGDTWADHAFPKILEKSRAIYHHLGMPYLEP